MSRYTAAKAAFYVREDRPMITAFVQFKLPKAVTKDQAKEIFLSTAPRYRDMPGLIRKYYLLSMDGGTGGGVYLWKSKEDAERVYSEEWRNLIREKYGAEATVEYFQSPVVVDNVVGDIIKDD
jgi:hypothetical protein